MSSNPFLGTPALVALDAAAALALASPACSPCREEIRGMTQVPRYKDAIESRCTRLR